MDRWNHNVGATGGYSGVCGSVDDGEGEKEGGGELGWLRV